MQTINSQEIYSTILKPKKPKESCHNFNDFCEFRAEVLNRLGCYSASSDTGIRDAYCNGICPYRERNFIPISELNMGNNEDEIKLLDLDAIEILVLVHEIDLDKYYRSEDANKDIGQESASQDFIEHHLPQWSKGFKESKKIIKERLNQQTTSHLSKLATPK